MTVNVRTKWFRSPEASNYLKIETVTFESVFLKSFSALNKEPIGNAIRSYLLNKLYSIQEFN